MRKIFQRRICTELQQPMKFISPSKPLVKPLAKKPWKMLSTFSVDSLQIARLDQKMPKHNPIHWLWSNVIHKKTKAKPQSQPWYWGNLSFLVLPSRGWYSKVSENWKEIFHHRHTQQTWRSILRQISRPLKIYIIQANGHLLKNLPNRWQYQSPGMRNSE